MGRAPADVDGGVHGCAAPSGAAGPAHLLYRIAHCQAVSHARKLGREPLEVDGASELRDILAAESCRAAAPFDTAEQVHAGLANLSLPQR